MSPLYSLRTAATASFPRTALTVFRVSTGVRACICVEDFREAIVISFSIRAGIDLVIPPVAGVMRGLCDALYFFV